MKHWSRKITIAVVLCSLTVMWIGCSDNNDVIVSNYNTTQLSGVESYYPLTEGYQTMYSVHDITGTDYNVVNRITGVDTSLGYALVRQTSIRGGIVDTGFFYLGTDAILYFDYPNSSPEKFLQYPLSTGSTWNRFQTAQDDFTTILPDLDKGNNTNTKTVPTDGSSEMIVAGSDFLSLKLGGSFSHTIKIVNTGSNGTQNAYWFAPGVGLVKYIYGVSINDPTTGNVVGELTSYEQL